MAQDDGLVTIGAGRYHVHRHTTGLLDALEVIARIRRQILVTRDPDGALRPSRNFLIDRFAPGQCIGARWKNVDQLAADLVTDTDLQCLDAIEHVEVCDAQAGYAIDLNGTLERCGIEPATPSRPSGHRAEFLPARAQLLADIVFQFRGKRPRADARGIGLGDA